MAVWGPLNWESTRLKITDINYSLETWENQLESSWILLCYSSCLAKQIFLEQIIMTKPLEMFIKKSNRWYWFIPYSQMINKLQNLQRWSYTMNSYGRFLFLLKFKNLVYECFYCLYICSPSEVLVVVETTRPRVTDDCKLPCGWWEQNL